MKSSALPPTEENIKSTLVTDAIGRNEDIRHFLRLLNSLEGSYSIALDGGWGSGKTFFVRQLKLVLDCLNKNPHVAVERETQLHVEAMILQKKESEAYDIKRTFSTVYYDAWLNDNCEDPIVTLLYTFATQLAIERSAGKSRTFSDIALSIIDAITGKNISSIEKAIVGENLFDGYVTEQMIREKFSALLTELIEERGDRLVVFIDELDRCSPAFAIKLLERVKHYLLDERVIFVFSVNMVQLKHTVTHFYGTNFAGDKYLDRFFDMVVGLPAPNYQRFFQIIGFEQSSFNAMSKVCHIAMKVFRLELREMTRFVDTMNQFDHLIRDGARFSSFGRAQTTELCIAFLLPVMLGLRLKNLLEYTDFIEGRNFDAMMEVYSEPTQGEWLARLLLNRGEVLNTDASKDGEKSVVIEEKIREFYDAVFVNKYSSIVPEVHLGKFTFDSETRMDLLRIIGSLSNHSNYGLSKDEK